MDKKSSFPIINAWLLGNKNDFESRLFSVNKIKKWKEKNKSKKIIGEEVKEEVKEVEEERKKEVQEEKNK